MIRSASSLAAPRPAHPLHSLLLMLLVFLLAAPACGGGGGSTPPPGNTGTVSGTITVNPNLGTSAQADTPRVLARIIDPQDIIAGAKAEGDVAADGTFTLTQVPARTQPYYLQIRFTASGRLEGNPGDTVPMILHFPVQVSTNGTASINAVIEEFNSGGTLGMRIAALYAGPDGQRSSDVLLDLVRRTVGADLNGQRRFTDDVGPDDNRDGLRDDRNARDQNPGAFTEVEREGVIQSIANDQVTVLSTTFRITAATNIFDKVTGAALRLADFNPGDPVNIKGFTRPGSEDIFATRLRREAKIDDNDPVDPIPGRREVEREGLLAAKTANSVTVRDLTFQVVERTLIVIKDTGAPIALADIPIGGCVDVKGNLTSEGLIATRIRFDTTCNDGGQGGVELEVAGRIQAISPESITVADRTFAIIPPVTVLNKDTGQPLDYSVLQVDDFVDVKGIQQGDTLRAVRIRRDSTPDDPSGGTEVEREGLVQAVTLTSITVQNTTFAIIGTTVIEDKDTKQPLPLSSLTVGADVNVKGIQQGANLIATRIRVDRD